MLRCAVIVGNPTMSCRTEISLVLTYIKTCGVFKAKKMNEYNLC